MFDNANDYSFGLKSNFERAFQAAGGKVYSESYTTGTKDFNAQIAQIKSQNPDVIFLPDYYNTIALIAKQIRDAGITVPLLGADGWDDVVANNLMETEGSYYSNHFAPDVATPEAKAFLEAYNKRWGYAPDALAALGYDATKILLNAIAAAAKNGTITKAAIRDEIAKTNGTFATGKIYFDANRNTVKSAVILQIIKVGPNKLATKYVTTINP